jgi:hypothetical protein
MPFPDIAKELGIVAARSTIESAGKGHAGEGLVGAFPGLHRLTMSLVSREAGACNIARRWKQLQRVGRALEQAREQAREQAIEQRR